MGARLAVAACIPAGDFERRATQQELIMKKIARLTVVLAAALALQSYTGPARAQGQAWISATGNDVNTSSGCQASAPCLSFHAALSQTFTGGEVGCLGSASDFEAGATEVTFAVTIDCHGAPAEYLATDAPNINGFVISAAGAVVTLRGLNIDGTNGLNTGGTFGLNGVVIEAAAVVNIEDCVIENFAQSAISVTTSANTVLNIRNTSIKNSANGISFAPTGGAVNGSIDHTMIAKMSGDGITTNTGSVFFTVTDSVISNAAGVGVNVASGTALEVDSSSVSNNNIAFATSGGTIRISRNNIYDNNTNFSISGGTIATAGNNDVAVNGSTVPNGTITQQ
jgi:hypothetical protein